MSFKKEVFVYICLLLFSLNVNASSKKYQLCELSHTVTGKIGMFVDNYLLSERGSVRSDDIQAVYDFLRSGWYCQNIIRKKCELVIENETYKVRFVGSKLGQYIAVDQKVVAGRPSQLLGKVYEELGLYWCNMVD